MKRALQSVTPEILLRLGLGIMFVYSGVRIIRYPIEWAWAVAALPGPIEGAIERIGVDAYLRMQGAGEIAIGVILLAWFLPRKICSFAALVAAAEMLAILALVGVDAATFRDIGLLGAVLALFVLLRGALREGAAEPAGIVEE